MYHLPWFRLNGGIHHRGADRDDPRLLLVHGDLDALPSVHDARVHDLQINAARLSRHDCKAGMFVHPSVLIVAIVHLELQFFHKLGDVLESVVVRILPQHKHAVVHQPDIPDTVYEFHPGPLRCPVLVIHLKERAGSKIAHLIAVAYDINGLSENTVPIPLISLLSQRVVPELVGPQIQFGIVSPVKQLHGQHQRHITGKHHTPGPQAFQVKLRLHPLGQHPIHICQKQ